MTLLRRAIFSLIFLAPVLGCRADDAGKAAGGIVHTAAISAEGRQTVKGWGCNALGLGGGGARFGDKPAAQQAILVDLGMTINRIPLDHTFGGDKGDGDGSLALDFPAAGDSHADQLGDYVKACRAKGVPDYYLVIYSPPLNLKTEAIVGSRSQLSEKGIVTLRPDKCAAFAAYLANLLDYLAKKGAPLPVAISIQNEPNAPVRYDSCDYAPEAYNAVIVKAREILDARGYAAVALIGPELGSYEQIEEFLGPACAKLRDDPKLGHAYGAIAAHSYKPWRVQIAPAGADKDALWDRIVAKYAAAVRGAGRDLWMSEYCTGQDFGPSPDESEPEFELEQAIVTARMLAADMAAVPNNYWLYWHGWSYWWNGKNHDSLRQGEVLADGEGRESVTKSKLYHVLQAVWHGAPPGSVVHKVSCDDSGLVSRDAHQMDMVAFARENSTTVLLVNPTTDARILRLEGLSGSRATVRKTTLDQDMVPAPPEAVTGGKLPVTLPARSVVVITTSA